MQTDVIVIGGGATGCGVAWDLSLRGVRVILVEKGGLGAGTSGRYHGLLHSGGRYAVADPDTARECALENCTVRRIAAPAVAATGGLFVQGRNDDASYIDEWLRACIVAGIPVREIPVTKALAQEPGLDPGIRAAFSVPDAVCNAFTLCSLLARGAEARGASILTHHEMKEFLREGCSVVGVRVQDARSGAAVVLHARLTIIAAGPWGGELARRAGAGLTMSLARGAMLAYEGLLVRGVVNRLQPPGDGDILLPRGSVSIAGTTIVPTEDPDDRTVSSAEIDRITEQIANVVPVIRGRAVKHSWAGVRPLYGGGQGPDAARGADPHLWSRDFAVIDHAAADGIEGLMTIVGGKLTTFRLMAERTADAACRILGVAVPCSTATTPLT
jgi:glycerol-3-phosphate dehydrogenase